MTVDAEEAERLELSLEIFARFTTRREPRRMGRSRPCRAGVSETRLAADRLAGRTREADARKNTRATGQGRLLGHRDQARAGQRPRWVSGFHAQGTYRRVVPGVRAPHARPRRRKGVVFPMFATHNAHTVAAIAERARELRVPASHYEFQRLHGMGEALYGEVTPGDKLGVACRVYAPVGSHQDLLPYLVRRLLENGANTSFVNRIADVSVPVAEIVSDPVARVRAQGGKRRTRRCRCRATCSRRSRENSRGVSLADQPAMATLDAAFVSSEQRALACNTDHRRRRVDGPARNCSDPGDHRRASARSSTRRHRTRAMRSPARMPPSPHGTRWAARPVPMSLTAQRLPSIVRATNWSCCSRVKRARPAPTRSAKCARPWISAATTRCSRARTSAIRYRSPRRPASPTSSALHGRGVFACISPWNFPLAIYVGQIAAALAAGNAVIAKPAEQTPLIAPRASRLLLDSRRARRALRVAAGAGRNHRRGAGGRCSHRRRRVYRLDRGRKRNRRALAGATRRFRSSPKQAARTR